MKNAFVIFLFVAVACTREEQRLNRYSETALILRMSQTDPTRAANPDEFLITDCNLLIYNAFGDLEERSFFKGTTVYHTRLLRDVPYTFVAAANLGYALPALTLEEVRQYRYHLAYPDEYSRGMPMAAVLENVIPGPKTELLLERLMARIDLETDRSGLDPGILVKITDASVGNCPSSVTLFPGSEATDCFTRGFTHSNTEVEGLNQSGGLVSLHVLENCSGSTYVEIKAEYHSDEFHTEPGERISYKIPLEELRRNTVYPVTISLSGKLEGNLSSKEW